jgi:hypothetical protein
MQIEKIMGEGFFSNYSDPRHPDAQLVTWLLSLTGSKRKRTTFGAQANRCWSKIVDEAEAANDEQPSVPGGEADQITTEDGQNDLRVAC